MKLILASNSRTRKEVLDKVGLIYDVDLYQNKKITLNEITEVYFDELTEEEID